MSCKSCCQLASVDKGRALFCKIRITKLTFCLNFRYKFIIMVYWWYTSYFFIIKYVFRRDQLFLGLRLIFVISWHIFVIFPFSLIDFCINEILNISKVKLKIMVAFMIGYIFVNLIFIFYQIFYFSIKPWRFPVIKNLFNIWNKIAHDIQECFIK